VEVDRVAASAGLLAAAGLHAAWGAGSAWLGLGLAGQTRLVSPVSVSARFTRLDRRVYSPLCLTLAGLAALSIRPSHRAPSRRAHGPAVSAGSAADVRAGSAGGVAGRSQAAAARAASAAQAAPATKAAW
jgi:hypothetical protein